MPQHPECRRCELHQWCLTVGMDGRGPTPADVMVVGEAPGKSEDAAGQPFVGRSGKLLESIMRWAGIEPAAVRITNAVRCRPPNNRKPAADEVAACREWLYEEIDAVKPRIILACGDTAIRALLRRSGVGNLRGREYEVYLAGRRCLVIPTYHPAAVLRRGGATEIPESWKRDPYMEAMMIDFRRAARLLQGVSKRLEFVIIEGRIGPELLTDPVVVYDVEIDEDGVPNLVTLTTPLSGAVYALKPQAHLEDLRRVLGRRNALIVGHNMKTDNRWMRQIGVEVGPDQFDTMVAAHRLNENRRIGLKALAVEYFDADAYWSKVEEKIKGSRSQIKWADLVEYSAHDAAYTARLYSVLRPELESHPRLWTTFRHLDMPLSRIFERMEDGGILIDRARAEGIIAEAEAIQSECEEQMNILAQRRINWRSYDQVADVLYRLLGLPVAVWTENGDPSTGAEALSKLRGRHPIVDWLLRWRKAESYRRLAAAWRDRAGLDGWVRSIRWNLCGTRTGRVSSSDPNAQNLHRAVQGWPNIRSMLVAPPGHVILGRDYSQIELRVAAWLFEERAMRAAYTRGEDLHTRTAKLLLDAGACPGLESREVRNRAKIMNFGLLYGLSAHGFREYAWTKYELALTPEEAEQYHRLFFSWYPDLPRAYRRIARFLEQNGYVESPLGRRRHLPEVYSRDESVRLAALREAINAPVQGTASDLASLTLVLAEAELARMGARPFLHLHDALYWYVPEGRVDEAAEVTRRVMEEEVPRQLKRTWGVEIPVPLVSELKVGSNLGEL